MGFDWKEYLILAQFLSGDSGINYSEEAARRASVSRAYYAAFCSARNYASSNLNFAREKKGEDHKNLILWYSLWETKDPNLSGIADNLDELRGWRNTCDYDDIPQIFTNLALLSKNALKDAEEIIDAIR
ncbi:MAG: hypothetical protein PHN90_07645 [Methanothrix sp.]|nr:hypothetical protein [Methanothrix sp.]